MNSQQLGVMGRWCGFGLACLLAAPVGAAHSYSLRQGAQAADAIDLGVGRAADLWWANAYQAEASGPVLTEVKAAFGPGWTIGTPVSVLIYDDVNNNGQPDDLNLLTQIDAQIQTINGSLSDTFTNTFNIPATTVNGSFFVAILAQEAPQGVTIRGETHAPGFQSWLAINTLQPGRFDPADPSAAEQGPLFVESFTSNPSVPQVDFVIDVVGVPEPATGLLLLMIGAALISRRKS